MPNSDSTNKGAEAISSNSANQRFGELMQRAQHAGERFIVTRHGRPAAAIVSIADLEKLTELATPRAA